MNTTLCLYCEELKGLQGNTCLACQIRNISPFAQKEEHHENKSSHPTYFLQDMGNMIQFENADSLIFPDFSHKPEIPTHPSDVKISPNILPIDKMFFELEKSPPTSLYNEDPQTLLQSYLNKNEKIRNAMICSFYKLAYGSYSGNYQTSLISYDSWDSYYKKILENVFVRIVNTWRKFYREKNFDYQWIWLSNTFPVNPDNTDFTLSEMQNVYFCFTAHSIFLDIYDRLSWKLTDYPSDVLELLLNSKFLFYERPTHKHLYRFGYPLARGSSFPFISNHYLETEVSPCHPIFLYKFLIERNLVNYTGIPENPMEMIPSAINPTHIDLLPTSSSYPEVQLTNLLSKIFSKDELPSFVKDRYSWIIDSFSSEINVSTKAAKRSLSVISRWFLYHMIHITTEYSYDTFFSVPAYQRAIHSPIDRSLNIPLEQHRRKPPHPLNPHPHPELINYTLNESNLFDNDGNPPTDLTVLSNKDLLLTFNKYSCYHGCHSAAGILYWLLRSINIPARKITTFQINDATKEAYNINLADPDPSGAGTHGGIVVHLPKQEKNDALYLHHLDALYAYDHSASPIVDPLNFFVDENTYFDWFGLPLRSTNYYDFKLFEDFLYGFLGLIKYVSDYIHIIPSGSLPQFAHNIINSYGKKTRWNNPMAWSSSIPGYEWLASTLLRIAKFRTKQLSENLVGLPKGFAESYGSFWKTTISPNSNFVDGLLSVFNESSRYWNTLSKNFYLQLLQIPTDFTLIKFQRIIKFKN